MVNCGKTCGDKRFRKVYYVGVELYNTNRTRVLLNIKEFYKCAQYVETI